METKDLILGETQCCLICDEVKPLELGEAVIRYGSFIEYTCYKCKDKENKNKEREALCDAILEDVSDVIVKHLPNFDNNIEAETWAMLNVFVEETVYQLTTKDDN
jgi:hypothetical protein